MMGTEPFLKALDNGAEVVVAGRASDCAIFAGIPIQMGVDPGIAWHAAKILECGAAAAVSRSSPDCMFATLRKDHFDVETPNPEMRCTPQSVAAHSLYENGDPYRLVESSGVIDLTQAEYEALDDRRVRVRGSRFEAAGTYTVKIEGAEHVGYQSIVIGSIRDPYIIRQIDSFVERLKERVKTRAAEVYAGDKTSGEHLFNVRVYGKDGTMGPLEPVKEIRSHEVCLVMEVTAATQEIATTIVSMARHQALHLPIPEWSGLITGWPAFTARPIWSGERSTGSASIMSWSRTIRARCSPSNTQPSVKEKENMAKLGELARLIRSKNAGPFELTFDIMFDDEETFQRVKESNALSGQVIAEIYRVPLEDVKFFVVPAGAGVQGLHPPAELPGRPAGQ